MTLTVAQDTLLRSVIDSMAEKVCLLDTSLRAVYFNKAFGELVQLIHGFTPEYNESIYDKTAESYYKTWYPILKNALLGEYFEQTISATDQRKNPLHYKVVINPLLNNEEVKGIMIKINDITQEKLNEIDLTAFRQLAENLPNTDVLFCDTDFNILIAGGGEMKKYGVDGNYFIGKNLVDVAMQLNLEMLIPFYHQTLVGVSQSLEYEYGNEYYWLETYPIFENNKVQNIIVITRNITDLKRMNMKLQQLNNTKDSILGIVAHDLRNPITAIIGLSDLLKVTPQETEHYVNLINRSCNNALSIIVDLLDITELGNDTFKLDTDTTELNAFINDILVLENHNAINKNIKINFETNRDDIFVRINHDKFARVISNLISNAVKFSHSDSRIMISTLYNHNMVLIKVQDQGIGIPPVMQEVIFDKFTKAGRKGTAGEKSFGLGMSIVKQIVELHDGNIWLESEENKGTAVYIELKSAI